MPPKRRQIADYVADEIRAGRLRPGDPLPSSPVLADKFDASIASVRAAMAVLKERGIVEFVPGVGMFVAQKKNPGR